MKNLIISFLLAFMLVFQARSQSISLEDLQIAATATTASCPFMLDSETRFDRCDALRDDASGRLVIQYTYTLVNILKSEYSDGIKMDIFKNIMDSKLTKSIKNTTGMSIIRDNNIVVSYVYYDKIHNLFMIIKVTPEKYNDPNI